VEYTPTKALTMRRKPTPQGRLAVCDGRIRVGHVELIDGRWRSIDINGEIVGVFTTQREATRALPLTEVTP
jgi:hypothetical protein